MKTKKLLSIFLVVIMVLGICPLMNASAAEKRTVIDSGFCGVQGDNLKWTLFDDGELVISGEGEMDWYAPFDGEKTAPWNDYFDTIKVITIEEGVTSIGKYAFLTPIDADGNYEFASYYRINLPLSFEYFEGRLSETFDACRADGNILAVCYPGTDAQWAKVTNKGFKYTYNEETGKTDRELISLGFFGEKMTVSKPVNGFRRLYLNGEEPTAYCQIRDAEKLAENLQGSSITLCADYYIGDMENAKLEWSFKGRKGEIESVTNGVGMDSVAKIKGFTKGKGTVTLELVSADGTVISADVTPQFVSEAEDEITVFDIIFSYIGGFFYEIILAFGFGINIFIALLAMPFQ